MAGFSSQVLIDASPQKIFDVITDLKQWQAMMPDLVSTVPLQDGPMVQGYKWNETRKFRVFGFIPFKGSAIIEVTAIRENRRLTTESEDAGSWASYDFQFQPSGELTEATLDASFEARGKHAGDPLKAAQLAKWCEKLDGNLLDRLKAHVEAS
jgi:hypothetical protein